MKHAPLNQPLAPATIDVLATLLDLPAARIEQAWVDTGKRSGWRTFVVGKKRRRLHVPSESIADLHRAILTRMLHSGPQSPAAYGGVPGRSYVDAARRHLEDGTDLLALDIASAFDSTTYRVVAAAMRRRLRDDLWMMGLDGDERAQVAGALTQMVMVRHTTLDRWTLPAGAPASVAVFNLVCHDIDRDIEKWLATQGERTAVYTRYVDDMVVSHVSNTTIMRLPDAVRGFLRQRRLHLNDDKIRQMDGGRAEVYRLRRGPGSSLALTEDACEQTARQIRNLQAAIRDRRHPEPLQRMAVNRLLGIRSFVHMVYGDDAPAELTVRVEPQSVAAPVAVTIDDLWL